MKSFFQSIYFKIGSIILIIEIIVLTAVGTVYSTRFFAQIDERVLERSQLLGELINANLIRILSINDPDSMQLLIGEEVIDVFLTTPEQTIFYSQNRNLVGSNVDDVPFTDLEWFNVDNPQEIIEQVRDESGSYVITVSPISLSPSSDSIDFFLYTRANTTEAEAEKNALVGLLVIGTITTIILTSITIIVAFNIILLRRINNLAEVMRRAEDGNLTVQVRGNIPNDELGILEVGANSMISRLNDLFSTLEQRVADRTRDLKVAADVSRQITTMLDIDQLLQEVVVEANKAFQLNFSSIFLLRDKKLVRVSNSDETGKHVEDVVQVYELTDKPSIVAEAARTLKTINIGDIKKDAENIYNPSVQGTRSELAIPMLLGSVLIGVFDVQSAEVDHFQSDDVQVLTTLAEQIAIAVRNAELFSEAQSARNEAEKSNQVKSQFLASMSHELRTPLNAIMNFTRFNLMKVYGDINQEQEDSFQKILSSAEHLLSLINDVLDIAKIESGNLQFFIEKDINLNTELDTVVASASALLAEKPVKLITDIDVLPRIVGDKRRIRQILLNLMSNACKFTDTGNVTIRAKHKDSSIEFSVSDTGFGINEDNLDLIFEPFIQTGTGVQHVGGTGLGLPITKRLVEAHHGRIWLETKIGEGSTFYVLIPIQSDELLELMN